MGSCRRLAKLQRCNFSRYRSPLPVAAATVIASASTTTTIATTTTATATAAVNAAAAPTSPQNELDLPQIAVKSEMNLIHVRRDFRAISCFSSPRKRAAL